MALGKINIFENNWVDIVFKGRNHSYGAYVLRKKSDEYTVKGIIYAIIFFTLVVSSPMIVNFIKGMVPKPLEDVVVTEAKTLDEPPPLDEKTPPPPPVEPPPPLKSTIKFTPPEVKPDEEVPDEPPPTQEDMKDKDVSTKTEEGDLNGIDASLQDEVTGGDGKEEVLLFAEQQAEFDGDLNEYLVNNVKYPQVARDNGIEGQVVVQFVVGKDGKIDENTVTIVSKRQLGWGCEEEAMRVVRNMPPWRPAKQNGNPAALRCQLPIRFKLQE